ncbi:MAG: TonB-dependent receptor [Methylophilus sp.]|nr:TonB-dependent receptor [Methylophilus sp.]
MSIIHLAPTQLKIIPLAIATAFSLIPTQSAYAEESEKMMQLAPIVITGTRTEQNSFDLPIAIDVVKQEDIQNGQLQMTLSESLIRVPGITAQNRTQQAQDPQISSRGFGSRSAFGVRGVRVYVDGIPLTMPDGQGQPGVVDLSAIKSIEVMRGPFSALYGNSSGGVIQLFTEDAPDTPEIGGTVMFGSYNTKRQVINAAGIADGVEYLLNASNFESDGYRDNSESDKQQATAKFKFNISEDTKLTTLINWFEQDAQDPIGLDRARAFNNSTRDGVVPASINANTSVSRSHTQVGFNFEHAFNENNKLSFIPYVGTRKNAQILTTSPTATTLATTNARLSEIDREFYGTDARWDNSGNIASMPYNISLGITYGKSSDDRLDTNVLGSGLPISVLNRREENISTNFDRYVQGKLTVLPSVDLHAGVRRTKVQLEVKDDFTSGVGSNGNNSGSVSYEKTTPVFGVTWKVSPSVNLYANYGKGFETPTFIEAAFNTTAADATPNLSLKPSNSENFEIGAKTFLSDNTQANLTLFHIKTNDEIVTNQTLAGRSTFANANSTKRTGAEFSLDSDFDYGISTFFSYSLLNAKFDSDFTPTGGTIIQAGNRIPGTYRSQIYGEIAWQFEPVGFMMALEGRHNSKVYVNDRNTDTAPSYTIFNLRAGFEQNLAHWQFKEYIRVENMFDKEYIGSVRVNDGNALFFEPAADRNYLLGLSAAYKF